MPTQILTQGIAPGAITADKLAVGAVSQNKFAAGIQTGSSGPTISSVTITDDAYSPNGQTHMPTEGGYFKIIGTNFSAGIVAAIGSSTALATVFVSSTELHVQAPAKSEGSYQVQVTNTNGGWAFKANAITYSGIPTWSTSSSLTSGVSGTAYSLQMSATGATSYSLAPGSTLPTGLTLTSGGLLSGTVTVGADTNYTFTIRAVDAENQYSSRTFNLAVNVKPPPIFTLNTAVNGKTTWNLEVDGPLTISSNNTLTPTGNFTANFKMWGAGGAQSYASGGAGGYVGGTMSVTTNDVIGAYPGPSNGGSNGFSGAGGAGGTPSPHVAGSAGTEGGGGGGGGFYAYIRAMWVSRTGGGGGAPTVLVKNGTRYAVAPGGGGSYSYANDSLTSFDVGGGAGGTGNGAGGNRNNGGTDWGAGGPGSGGAFVQTPTGWTAMAGSGTTPGNSSDANRGSAGDSGQPGAIVLTAVS